MHMMATEPGGVTTVLNAWGNGNQDSGNELVQIVYSDLRRLAAHYLKDERPDHTLQPTSLVHELYLKLFRAEPVEWRDRGHFFTVAARQLRHTVVHYARHHHAAKRGGPLAKILLQDTPDRGISLDRQLLDLDLALERLAELDARSAEVVELRYFGGLTESEIADALGVSTATVKRDWEFARAWLLKQLS